MTVEKDHVREVQVSWRPTQYLDGGVNWILGDPRH